MRRDKLRNITTRACSITHQFQNFHAQECKNEINTLSKSASHLVLLHKRLGFLRLYMYFLLRNVLIDRILDYHMYVHVGSNQNMCCFTKYVLKTYRLYLFCCMPLFIVLSIWMICAQIWNVHSTSFLRVVVH